MLRFDSSVPVTRGSLSALYAAVQVQFNGLTPLGSKLDEKVS